MVDMWYDETINKIRITADPGGEALTVEEANKYVNGVLETIRKAQNGEGIDCDECGTGGGGLCPACKAEVEIHER